MNRKRKLSALSVLILSKVLGKQIKSSFFHQLWIHENLGSSIRVQYSSGLKSLVFGQLEDRDVEPFLDFGFGAIFGFRRHKSKFCAVKIQFRLSES